MNIHTKVCGFYKLEAIDINSGNSRILADWFPNLITDNGLNLLGNGGTGYLGTCQVGSGNATPIASDTTLANKLANTSTFASYVYGVSSTSPYYCYKRMVYRFSAGTATGNISEVGVSPTGSNTGNLFSRALVLDGQMNPTTVTVLSNETLDVTYEIRYYAPTNDITGEININGVTYAWTSRPARATSSSSAGWAVQNLYYGGAQYVVDESNTESWISTGGVKAYSGSIGDVTSYPGGSVSNHTSIAAQSYVANSHYIDHVITYGISDANFAGGIGSISGRLGIGSYQIGFTPSIPKTSDDSFSITIRHSWGRA